MTIVVVDDEPTIVLMCRRVLEAQGHTVRGFTDVHSALTQLQAEPADPAGDSGSTLPRTGLPALILAASGAALFASGGALRRRAERPDLRRPAGRYVPWEAHRAVRERH